MVVKWTIDVLDVGVELEEDDEKVVDEHCCAEAMSETAIVS